MELQKSVRIQKTQILNETFKHQTPSFEEIVDITFVKKNNNNKKQHVSLEHAGIVLFWSDLSIPDY